ncbi:MAG TPA: hypothetical protein VL361_21120 [Candidatus Limnocylindrales bacterium]|jgi:hypothetical protein|nr:hypothetical protein [Candidatus Limnocylindrales bacterium]
MQTNYRNKNRGYQQLRFWGDAIDYYVLNCKIESLQRKQEAGDWIDSLIIKESNIADG